MWHAKIKTTAAASNVHQVKEVIRLTEEHQTSQQTTKEKEFCKLELELVLVPCNHLCWFVERVAIQQGEALQLLERGQ